MINISREDCKACVGPGWAKLIDKIYDKLPPDAFIEQVKEKYGTLRFYVSNISEEIWDYVHQVESESSEVCEQCGKPGKLYTNGWWRTLCADCEEERMKKRNFYER